MIRYLIAGDPVAQIQPKYDTSIRIAAELLKRGHEVEYLDLASTNPQQESAAYLSALPVSKILMVDPLQSKNFITLSKPRKARVEEFQVILQRKDPPVDALFVKYAKHFSKAPERILQINNPVSAVKYNEHGLPMRYPQYSIPTVLAESITELQASVAKNPGESVLKPRGECSGHGVVFVKRNEPLAVLEKYFNTWGSAYVQPYQKEIETLGDLRILVFNKKVLGSVMRVPAEGSRLANLHQGAEARFFQPTTVQLEATKFVAEDLNKKGLYFLGLDFIGDKISEVNITSPSALAQINEVTGHATEVMLVKEIENLRQDFAQKRAGII